MKSWASRVATVFGIGWAPFAPGTVGSAVAVPVGAAIAHFGWIGLSIAIVLVTALGIWTTGLHAKLRGVHDPSECVIDEVAGQWIALIPVAIWATGFQWRPLAMGFFLFRLFDILKPWPLRQLEEMPGGAGIMMDDVGAGLIAGIIVAAFLYIRLV
jgi:phosphatidylglycerophosphatase A